MSYELSLEMPVIVDSQISTSVILNDLERHNSPYLRSFTELDTFAG